MADGTIRPGAKTGRARAAEGTARDQVLGLRLTPDERAAIDAQAARAGLTVSDYARRVILGHRVKPAVTDVDAAALVELNRLGVNLNQVAKQLNARKAAPAHIEPLLVTIRAAVERRARGASRAAELREAGEAMRTRHKAEWQAFGQAAERDRAKIASRQKAMTNERVAGLKAQRAGEAARVSDRIGEKRQALIERQNAERAALRKDWREAGRGQGRRSAGARPILEAKRDDPFAVLDRERAGRAQRGDPFAVLDRQKGQPPAERARDRAKDWDRER